MTQTPHDPRDSGLFDLETLLEERAPSFPPPWVEIRGPDPTPPPSRRSTWWAVPLAGLVTAFTAVAFAWAPALPAAPMQLSVETTASSVEAAPVPIDVIPEATGVHSAPEPEVAPTPRRVTATGRARPALRPTPAPRPSTSPAHSWQTGGVAAAPMDRGLDALLDQAVGGAPSDPRPSAAASLPATPTRRQVSTTLRALEGEVRQCGEGAVTVRLTVDGDTGRVGRASVAGAESAEVGRCVAGVVESARFPRFAQDAFVVVFPYRL